MRFVGADAPPSVISDAPPEVVRNPVASAPSVVGADRPHVVADPTRPAPLFAGAPRVDSVFDPRSNAIGVLRLAFALLVVVAHSYPLGFGEDAPLFGFSSGQTDLGALSVAGFFVLSGLLVTRSATRASVPRFFWHRALRILPGLWVCLTVTACVVAPLLWWLRENTFEGYLGQRPSPVTYITGNLFAAMDQYGIGSLLGTTPYGHLKDGASIFNGSLWTLRYEIFCYLAIGLLAAAGVVRRKPSVVVMVTAALWGMVALDWLHGDRFGNDVSLLPTLRDLPLLGNLGGGALWGFGLTFAIGAVAALQPHRFPITHGLGAGALLVSLLSMRFGGWDVIGMPAFAYAVLWAGMRLPRALHRIGTRQDVSYGVYIYAFPIQQCLALFHLQRLGLVPFVLLSLALSMLAGYLSWHLVERQALRFKDAFRDRTPVRRTDALSPAPARRVSA